MKYLILIFVSLVFQISQAEIKTTCSDSKVNGQRYDYCVRTNTESRALIYFFHGLLGNSSSYNKVITASLDSKWKAKGLALPNVIGISFGSTWLMSDASGGKQLYPFFTNVVQPTLEKEFGFDSSYHRSLMGMSMGGFNAVEAFARNPGLYERAAFLCPALHNIGPYATDAEVTDFIQKTGASKQLVLMSQNIAKNEFTTPEAWSLASPMAVATNLAPVSAPIFVAVGDADQFGFQEGTQSFADLMKTKSPDVSFYLVKGGGHCSFPDKELAEFFEPSLR